MQFLAMLATVVAFFALTRRPRREALPGSAPSSRPAGVADDDEDPPRHPPAPEPGEEPRPPLTDKQKEAEDQPPDQVPADTAALVAYLLDREKDRNWKSKEPRVKAWQSTHELKPDGMYGPQTALAVAEESGTVPIVRYWAAGSQKHDALPDYEAELYAMAELADEAGHTSRAAQLRASAQRETGQGYGTAPPEDLVDLDLDPEELDKALDDLGQV